MNQISLKMGRKWVEIWRKDCAYQNFEIYLIIILLKIHSVVTITENHAGIKLWLHAKHENLFM